MIERQISFRIIDSLSVITSTHFVERRIWIHLIVSFAEHYVEFTPDHVHDRCYNDQRENSPEVGFVGFVILFEV